ncbi:precorrin-3B synthase [Actinoplanes tereljensis]|uniref:Precorrin-3B synthase n=1 Tax=Paractinoplanes tereljensis TaxID=571912 RepID=A0A919NH97_9ACTN|nr:precorrin-3B synthase [Actinoplanes tereljensis]GIF18089.1 precorrin-3B synthase [Actinoplanes tereljensis]
MPHPIRQSETDACPGALKLHQAADGPLARVRLPGGRLTGTQLTALAAIAAASGDGSLELTSRANVQLRALTRTNPTDLAARLSAAGLLPTATHETVRNIAAPPLADRPTRTLIHDLDAALCADPALAALPGRFLFALGTVPLVPDVAAVPDGDHFAVLFAGHDEGLRVPADRVVPALLAAAHAFLDARARHQGRPAWRLAELPGGARAIAEQTAARLGVTLRDEPALVPDYPASPVGVLPQPDGLFAVGAIVPLGRLTGVQMKVLAEADQLVVTPWRGVVVADLPPAAASDWQRRLTEAGLPAAPDSRWTGVTACAGLPGCAKSRADIRADALATTRFVDGLPVHWLGCERGCGSPAGPHVRVEATPHGYAVTTPDGPVTHPHAADLAAAVVAARRS